MQQKIMFKISRSAAIEFLEYNGKHIGNKLEREVYIPQVTG